MMNILHIVISRGWHAQVANAFLTIQHQEKTGYNQHIVTLAKSKLKKRLEVEIPSLPITTIEHYNSPNLISRLMSLLNEKPPAAIHIHGVNGQLRLLLALWLLKKDIPVVCSSRDKLETKTRFSHYVFAKVSQVIVPNQFVGKTLRESIKKPLRMNVIAPPVDVDKFKPIAKPADNKIRIGMFARFDEVKDYPVFFEACRLLKDKIPGMDIIVAGANFEGHQNELQSLIDSFDLKDKVTALGNLPKIEDEIAKLDIGVISSNGSEEISRIALEYMSCGVPVVSTDVGGMPELITPDVGLLVQHSSAKKLAQAIHQLAEDKERRQNLGVNARKKVLKENAINVYCQRLQEFYSNTP